MTEIGVQLPEIGVQLPPKPAFNFPRNRRSTSSDKPTFRAKLIKKRDKARADTRPKARFLSYRLNVPSAGESAVLLTVDDWHRVCGDEVAERIRHPIGGVDPGGRPPPGRRPWRSGGPDEPTPSPWRRACRASRRRRSATAHRLAANRRVVSQEALTVDEGQRVPPVATLVDRLLGWRPPRSSATASALVSVSCLTRCAAGCPWCRGSHVGARRERTSARFAYWRSMARCRRRPRRGGSLRRASRWQPSRPTTRAPSDS